MKTRSYFRREVFGAYLLASLLLLLTEPTPGSNSAALFVAAHIFALANAVYATHLINKSFRNDKTS